MSESSKKKRNRSKQTYIHRTNAVCITLYDLQGKTVPAEVRHQAEQAVTDIALANGLVINIATI